MSYGHTLMGASKAERLQYRAAFIPKTAETIHADEELALYRYPLSTNPARGFGVMTFWGSAGKPTTHYSYRTIEQANKAMAESLDSLALARVTAWQKAKTKKAWTNPLAVGTILYTSWGYDQTNVEFYIVTRVSGRRTWVREIAQATEATGMDQWRCWPAFPIQMTGEETMHTATPSGEKGACIKITESQRAHIEHGQTHYASSGH